LTRFLIALIIAITVLCWIFVGIFIRKSKTDDHRAYTIYKCLASLCFVLIALLSVIIKGSSSFGILVLFGLCFGFLGDLLLALRFHCEKNSRRFHLYFGIGSCSFLIGHFLYILALFRVSDHFLWIALLYTAIGMILSEWYASKNQVSPGSRIAKAGGTFYVAAVVFMGGCALGAAIKNPLPGTLDLRSWRTLVCLQRQPSDRKLFRKEFLAAEKRPPAYPVLDRPAADLLFYPVYAVKDNETMKNPECICIPDFVSLFDKIRPEQI